MKKLTNLFASLIIATVLAFLAVLFLGAIANLLTVPFLLSLNFAAGISGAVAILGFAYTYNNL
jgi:hypothetical protein